jgi:hypothetical protein
MNVAVVVSTIPGRDSWGTRIGVLEATQVAGERQSDKGSVQSQNGHPPASPRASRRNPPPYYRIGGGMSEVLRFWLLIAVAVLLGWTMAGPIADRFGFAPAIVFMLVVSVVGAFLVVA